MDKLAEEVSVHFNANSINAFISYFKRYKALHKFKSDKEFPPCFSELEVVHFFLHRLIHNKTIDEYKQQQKPPSSKWKKVWSLCLKIVR
jgi:hypothetical protein